MIIAHLQKGGEMADYIDRQAVVDVICDMHIGGKDGVVNALPHTYGADLREIIEQIDSLPSADVVEVVRCKDCKWHRGQWQCLNTETYGFRLDDYCSLAEMRATMPE